MALSIKTKQVAGVTLIVGLAVLLLSGWYVSSLATVWLNETRARAEFLANAIVHRAFDVVLTGGDPAEALKTDAGLRSILQASIFSPDVLYAAIVDTHGNVIAESDGAVLVEPADDLEKLLAAGRIAQARAIFNDSDNRSFEFRRPLLLGTTEFATVRIGVSTLLLRGELTRQMRTPLATTAIAIVLALVVAISLAQIVLRPIHVIRSGLARLGRGELNVNVDLPQDTELAELGDSFKAVSARLAADRTELEGQRATFESVVDGLEDAVALFSPNGTLLFANPVMTSMLSAAQGRLRDLLPAGHPYRDAVEHALASADTTPPVTVQLPNAGDRLVLTQRVEDGQSRLIGVMLVARNLAYLNQVESMLSYSRKLAALGRLSAGIAHEVKNPLNATMIHLELLKMQLADAPGALEHVAVIASQVRRLDEVVQGFLKFTRPEELQLQPVSVGGLVHDLAPIISAEAMKSGVELKLEFPPDLPPASADAGMLQQAFLNLALNACQAMPQGGKLRIAGSLAGRGQIAVVFEDTGVGIPPENLARIFDLYFTTKELGSGIGLSLVFRTVQLHDGEIEVQSVLGRGTTFRVLLRQSPVPARRQLAVPGSLGLRDVDVTPADQLSAS